MHDAHLLLSDVDKRRPLPETGAVLGVDVGYSPKKKSSAACCLAWRAGKVTWTIARFRHVEADWASTIQAVCSRQPILAAALDGPLNPTFTEIGRYRLAEQMLTRRLAKHIGKPGQSSAPVGRRLNCAANVYAAAVRQFTNLGEACHSHAISDVALVEAFPTSFLGSMIMQPSDVVAVRNDRSDRFFEYLAHSGGFDQLLAHLLPNSQISQQWAEVKNHDDRAALVCALTALAVASGSYVVVGDRQDGWIILPPRSLIAAWAWDQLKCNQQDILSER